jgi:hypothetical protein
MKIDHTKKSSGCGASSDTPTPHHASNREILSVPVSQTEMNLLPILLFPSPSEIFSREFTLQEEIMTSRTYILERNTWTLVPYEDCFLENLLDRAKNGNISEKVESFVMLGEILGRYEQDDSSYFFYCAALKEIRESINDFSTYLIYNSLLSVGQLLIQGLGPNKKAAKDIFCFLHNMIPDGEASHYIEL